MFVNITKVLQHMEASEVQEDGSIKKDIRITLSKRVW